MEQTWKNGLNVLNRMSELQKINTNAKLNI